MATVNLGRIKPVWKGAWNSSTQYIADDIVQYNNSAWTCLATNTNSAPSTGNSNWDLMALGANIPSQTGNDGKALLTDGTSLVWGKTTTPSGTTAERPVSPTIGEIRYNTTLNSLESYTTDSTSSFWASVGPFVSVRFNGNNGSVLKWTGNYSSISRVGTGKYTLTFASTEPNSNYLWYINTDTNSSRSGNHVGPAAGISGNYFSYGTNSFTFQLADYSSITASDAEIVWVALWRMP